MMNMVNREQVIKGYQMILDGLGYDWELDPHMADTPERAAKAMIDEICIGNHTEPPKMTAFPLDGKSAMVISRQIPVRSICAHHLLPFVGEAVVAYIPDEKILGLSKLSRAVEYWSRRPQVQETLTNQIADFLAEILELGNSGEGGVGVVIRARHFCAELRGVKHESDMITSALRGQFELPEVRAEFLALAGVSHGYR